MSCSCFFFSSEKHRLTIKEGKCEDRETHSVMWSVCMSGLLFFPFGPFSQTTKFFFKIKLWHLQPSSAEQSDTTPPAPLGLVCRCFVECPQQLWETTSTTTTDALILSALSVLNRMIEHSVGRGLQSVFTELLRSKITLTVRIRLVIVI